MNKLSPRKRIVIVTPERLEKINPKNKELLRKYFVGKNMKLSKSTKYNYESDINQFLIYIMENYDNQYLFDIDVEDMADILEDYIAFCSNILENKMKRIARRLSSISSLYLYFKKKRKVKENPLDLIERPMVDNDIYEIKQTYLTKEQVNYIRKELSKTDNIQLALFFELGLSTMARVNALSNILIEKIDLDNRLINDVKEKEGYNVTLFFSQRCKNLINKWLEYRKENNIDNDYLFITKYNKQWNKADKSVMQNNWIKQIGKVINEPQLHCHDLRHSGSNLLYHSGMPLEEVSELLNHKSTEVTQKFYIQVNNIKLQKSKDRFEF